MEECICYCIMHAIEGCICCCITHAMEECICCMYSLLVTRGFLFKSLRRRRRRIVASQRPLSRGVLSKPLSHYDVASCLSHCSLRVLVTYACYVYLLHVLAKYACYVYLLNMLVTCTWKHVLATCTWKHVLAKYACYVYLLRMLVTCTR